MKATTERGNERKTWTVRVICQHSRFVFVQDHTLHFKSSALFQEAFTGTEHINKPNPRHFSFNFRPFAPRTWSNITVIVLNEERDERINGDAV